MTKHDLSDVWNHIETINKEIGIVEERMARAEADLRWITWLVTIVLGVVLANSVGLVYKIFVG